MHGRLRTLRTMRTKKYLYKAVPPVVMLVQVFAEWFKGGGDCRHHTNGVTSDT